MFEGVEENVDGGGRANGAGEEFVAGGAVLFLPVGSTEAHGPHLPLSTDCIISLEMARRAARELEESGHKALVLPVVAYSVTDFSVDFPGSISVGSETATAMIRDICRSVIKQGFKRICVANSHLEPAHIESIQKAREIVERDGGFIPDAEFLEKPFLPKVLVARVNQMLDR